MVSKSLYPLLKIIFRLYFKFVNFVFWVIELPRRRRILDYPEDDLLLLSAIEAAELIRREEITSESLIQAYILRITHINRFLNAVVIQNFDDAIEEGRQVDSYIQHIDKDSDEYKSLPHKKPFLGVPFTLKDSMSVEGLVCTVGIPSRRNTVAEEDAEVVQRMRHAGAIVLAVTNVPEAIMWCESANTIYGRTNNPYNIRRTCGGSSGGEGALIAGAGSVIGLGSDVGGSIRIPAAFNGVFGLKPTSALRSPFGDFILLTHMPPPKYYVEILGIVSLKGSFPVVEGEDYTSLMWCIGPLCRYAKDLKPMLQVLAGDKAESLLHLHNPVNFRNIRIFYMEEINSLFVEPLHEDVRRALRKAVSYFEKKYDITSYRLDLPLVHDALSYWYSSISDSTAPPFTQYDVNCYLEVVKWIFGKSDHTLPAIISGLMCYLPHGAFDQQILESHRDQLRREIIDLLGSDGILLFPSWATVAPYHNQLILTSGNLAYTGLWNALTLPAIQIPMGVNSNGLPLAVQIISAPNMDRLLIAAASDLEEGFGGWTPTRSL